MPDPRQTTSGRRPRPLRTLFTAMLYGAALMSAVSNTFALFIGLGAGAPNWSNLSLGLLGWGIVLLIHQRRGWFPFKLSKSEPRA